MNAQTLKVQTAPILRTLFTRRAKISTLYLVVLPAKNSENAHRYVGYVIINMAAVKVVEANVMEDIYSYMESKGFKDYRWRMPKEMKYQLIKAKEW